MGCQYINCSCSLCPYMGTKSCVHYQDKKNDKKYWVYFNNRKDSTLEVKANIRTHKEIVPAIEKLVNKKIAKKYLYACELGEKINNAYPNAVEYTNDWLVIYVTNEECNWNTAIHIAYNTSTKEFFTFTPYDSSFTYSLNIANKKPWNKKISFK